MSESDLPRMQTQRWIIGSKCLRTGLAVVIGQIAPDRMPQMRQMQADLVRATGDGSSFDQSRSIGESLDDTEVGSGHSPRSIDVAGPCRCRVGTDRFFAAELI